MGFCGKLRLSGRVLVDDVSGAIQSVADSAGITVRSGYFQIPPGLTVQCTEKYELLLDDGQSLTIAITSIVPPRHPAIARFVEAAT